MLRRLIPLCAVLALLAVSACGAAPTDRPMPGALGPPHDETLCEGPIHTCY